jgi:hypothetical protein
MTMMMMDTSNPKDEYNLLTRSVHFKRHASGFIWNGQIIPMVPSYFFLRFGFSLLDIETEFAKDENQIASISQSYYLYFRFLRKQMNHSEAIDVDQNEALSIPKTFYDRVPISPRVPPPRRLFSKENRQINVLDPIQQFTITRGQLGFSQFLRKVRKENMFGIFLIQLHHTRDEIELREKKFHEIIQEEEYRFDEAARTMMETNTEIMDLFSIEEMPLESLF